MPRELYSYSRPVTEKPHAEVMLVNTQEHCTINTAEQRFKESKIVLPILLLRLPFQIITLKFKKKQNNIGFRRGSGQY